MKRFYGAVFGWRFEDYGPNYTSFMDGRLNGGFDKEREVSKGGALLVLYSKDLDATLAKVREAGGRIVMDTFSFPGGKRFHFTDPRATSWRCGRSLEALKRREGGECRGSRELSRPQHSRSCQDAWCPRERAAECSWIACRPGAR